MKSVRRSPADVKASMPPTANRPSGKISVCSYPASVASRSSSDPGSVAAEAANDPSPVFVRSAKTRNASREHTRMNAWKARAGRSSCRVPTPAGLSPASLTADFGPSSRTAVHRHTTAASAPASAASDSVAWTGLLARRGTKASTSTPKTAVPKTMRMGVSAAHSIVGVVTSRSLQWRLLRTARPPASRRRRGARGRTRGRASPPQGFPRPFSRARRGPARRRRAWGP